MTRIEFSENWRALCQTMKRSPIDTALYGFVALSDDDREELVRRFNAWQADSPHPSELNYQRSKA